MIFLLNERPIFEIVAICESEEELQGYRDEGARVALRLRNKVSRLQFEYLPRKIHPDIIALICYSAFYPFIKKQVRFPLDISLEAKRLFERFYLQTKSDGKLSFVHPIQVRNASDAVLPYRAKTEDSLISFGGGMDSTAVSLLFPEVPLVHQYKDFTQWRAVKQLCNRLNTINPLTKCHLQYTNVHTLADPEGFTSWTCCYLCALLMLVDLDARNIFSGSVIGSKYFGGGTRFIKPKGALAKREILESNGFFRDWSTLFAGIGIQAMDPLAGMTGILTAKMVYDHGLAGDVLYCQAKEGRPCHSCPKCFSKNLSLEYWEYTLGGRIRGKEYWQGYNEEDLRNYSRYLFTTTEHITNFLSKSVPLDNKPDWFVAGAKTLTTDTSWVSRVYPDSLDHILQTHGRVIRQGIKDHNLEMMSKKDVCQIENYDIESSVFQSV